MPSSALIVPETDPTPIFEAFRGNHATDLLTAAVAHLGVFATLAGGPLEPGPLRERLGLADRPFQVLVSALRALGLLRLDLDGRLELTGLAREHLAPGSEFDIAGYIGLAAESPGVLEMVERLRTNRPAGAAEAEKGAAFIYREGLESAMERETSARSLTMSLAGRARNVAPVLAQRYPIPEARRLLDVGGGSGIYAIAWLQKHPTLQAIVWDRPEVLNVAREMAESYGVGNRLETVAGDMFVDPVPPGADVILLSNVLHDWDVPDCRALLTRCANALPSDGQLLIHDVFLDDSLGGPLAIALYSVALFRLTEGRAYSAREYLEWMSETGLEAGEVTPTLIHCGVLPGFRRS
jgi:ubiquinone/menaquinone biosynthesis C-methylase UbiE